MHTKEAEIINLEERWNNFANKALGQSPISRQAFHTLFCDTFRILSIYDTNTTIPKILAPVFILMSEFAAYSLMSDDKQGFDPMVMSMLTTQLLACFTKGFQNSGSSYPVLKMPVGFKVDCVNIETHDLSGLRHRVECPF